MFFLEHRFAPVILKIVNHSILPVLIHKLCWFLISILNIFVTMKQNVNKLVLGNKVLMKYFLNNCKFPLSARTNRIGTSTPSLVLPMSTSAWAGIPQFSTTRKQIVRSSNYSIFYKLLFISTIILSKVLYHKQIILFIAVLLFMTIILHQNFD